MAEITQHESDIRKNLLFQKVGIFVDAENIELSSLKHHEARTDYKKIIEKVGDREILRILYYKPVYKEISATFREFWKRLGGEIKQPAKNADSFLIIDAVTMAEKLDVAIIVGGDKDYLPLVWYLKSRGCRVEIWSWPESTSPEVREAADVYFPLTKDFVMGLNEEPAKEAGPRPRSQPAATKVEPRPEPRPEPRSETRSEPSPQRTHAPTARQASAAAKSQERGTNQNERTPARSAAPAATKPPVPHAAKPSASPRPAASPSARDESVEEEADPNNSLEGSLANATRKPTRRGSRGGRGRRGRGGSGKGPTGGGAV